jgi:hypothetical protein
MPLKFLRFNYQPGPDQIPIVSLSRQDLWIAFGLAGVVILLGAWQMVVGVCGVYHDDAIYVITAKALAQGQGYRLIDLPNSPLQTKYPILYPALLSIIWKIWPSFPKNLVAMQGVSLCAGATSVALSYLYMVRFGYFTRGVAFASGLLCATSTMFLYFCTVTLSETTFALFSILALWAIDRQIRFPFDKRSSQILLGLVLALPFLTRTIGMAIIPAGLLALYLSKQRVRWVGFGASLIVFPWILWMLIVPKWDQNQINAYYTNYLSWWSYFGGLDLIRLVSLNILFICISIIKISLILFSILTLKYGIIILPICIFLGQISITCLLSQAKYLQLLHSYVIFYLCIIVLWPWYPSRFIIPILPFMIAYFIKGIRKYTSGYSFIKSKKTVYIVCLVLFLFINLIAVYRTEKISSFMKYPCTIVLDEPISWSSYESVFNWINNNTQADDIVASGLDTMVYLYTGHHAVRPFTMDPLSLFYFKDSPPMTKEELFRFLRAYQPKYLIETPMPFFSEEKPFSEIINETLIKYPGLLKTVYVGEDKRFLIYEIQPKLLAAAMASLVDEPYFLMPLEE